MAQAYSGDLRGRRDQGGGGRHVGAAGRRSVWCRRVDGDRLDPAVSANGEATARRQGKPRGSRLDAHADFILALVEADTKDISLAEIVERLEAERDLRVGITSVWKFLDRHGLTYKKRPPTPPSSSARTSVRRGRPGSTASSISTPTN